MRAVVFDLFETLVTEGRSKYMTRDVAADLGVEPGAFRRAWGALQRERYMGRFPDAVGLYKVVLESIGEKRDESLLRAVAQKRESCKRGCFADIEPMIMDMLEALKKRGFLIGLVSNCSPEEVLGLEGCVLTRYLDAVVLSCETGMVKPETGIYRLCMERLNASPEQCCFVGDGGSNELDGAARAGMTPIKALWFIKHFLQDFDNDRRYPSCLEPSDLIAYLAKQLP